MKTLLLTSLFLASCSVAPTVVSYPDGRTVATLGGSLFEKTVDESGAIALPNGTQIAYRKVGKDQTEVANTAVVTWGTVQSIIETAKGLNDGEAIRETNETRRVISDNGVKKAKIAGDVAVKTFVPPEP